MREKIEDVRTQAVKGVDFGTLARRYSGYKGPAGPEGDLGLPADDRVHARVPRRARHARDRAR